MQSSLRMMYRKILQVLQNDFQRFVLMKKKKEEGNQKTKMQCDGKIMQNVIGMEKCVIQHGLKRGLIMKKGTD